MSRLKLQPFIFVLFQLKFLHQVEELEDIALESSGKPVRDLLQVRAEKVEPCEGGQRLVVRLSDLELSGLFGRRLCVCAISISREQIGDRNNCEPKDEYRLSSGRTERGKIRYDCVSDLSR